MVNFSSGSVIERYEYNAYGDCNVLEPNFADDPDGQSDYGNPYLFTGRRVDILDDGSLKIQYNRNRYYDQHAGRWLTHDPLGITPNPQKPNYFYAIAQYKDGLSLYEYLASQPTKWADPYGLVFEIDRSMDLNKRFMEPRGRVSWSLKYKFECVPCSGWFGPKCKLKIDARYSLKLDLLRFGHKRWSEHFPRYDAKWGAPRSDARERQATMNHEFDHWKTSLEFWSQVVSQVAPFDEKKHSSPAICAQARDCLRYKVKAFYEAANSHTRSFDTSAWWWGGAYSAHPFIAILDVSSCDL